MKNKIKKNLKKMILKKKKMIIINHHFFPWGGDCFIGTAIVEGNKIEDDGVVVVLCNII